jgi:hypothetical protein
MRLTALLQLVPQLRMSATIPTLPQYAFMSCTGTTIRKPRADRRTVLCYQYFIAMDKSKLSEPAKGKVRLLKPSQISELIMDIDSDESGSDTATAEEEGKGGCEKIKSKSYSQHVHSPSHSYTGVPVFKQHTTPVNPELLKMRRNRVSFTHLSIATE